MNHQLLICIFAHPDDESFGPSGFITQQTRNGVEAHILCVTDGSAANNSAPIRKREFEEASAILGAEAHTLNYTDGELKNNNFKSIIDSISSKVESIISAINKPTTISFLTFEKNGLTGHLDHIAVSYATTYLFTHPDLWIKNNIQIGQLRYFCLCDAQKQEDLEYFVYSPKGYAEELIDETVDVSEFLPIKKRAILSHSSQEDATRTLERGEHLLSREHFMLYKK